MSLRVLKRGLHSEQSLRNSGLEGFVNGVAPESHGNGHRFVGAGIEILAVDQNHDRHQPGIAVGELHQTQSARAFAGLILRSLSGRWDSGKTQGEADDEAPGTAV